MSFPHPSDRSSSFILTFDPLFAVIDPSASTYSIMSTKVEVSLRKVVPGQKWPALEGTAPLKDVELGPESAAARAAVMSSLAQPAVSLKPESAPSYPTSSKSGPKNWDKLAETLTAKKKSTKKPKKDRRTRTTTRALDHQTKMVASTAIMILATLLMAFSRSSTQGPTMILGER